MLRVFRAALTRKNSTFRAFLSLSSPSFPQEDLRFAYPVSPPGESTLLYLPLVFPRDFSTSHPDKNGQFRSSPELDNTVTSETEAEECLRASDSEASEQEETLTTSELEDEDGHDPLLENNQDSDIESTPESCEDSSIDMTSVPDDLKEMLQDGYEVESAEEDLSTERNVELLTIDEVKQVLEEVRARDVRIFPVQDRCEWTDVMVVATGISDRHVRGIADALVFKIKKKGNIESPLYPTIEGQDGGKWLVVDCGNIVIHVLNEDSRGYYNLEDLWTGDVKPSTADEDLEKMLKRAGIKDVE